MYQTLFPGERDMGAKFEITPPETSPMNWFNFKAGFFTGMGPTAQENDNYKDLIGRAGFRVVERTTMYPMENYLYNGKDYTADASLGAELHGRVEARDLAMMREKRIAFYRDMAQNHEGREIVIVAVRE